MALDCLLDIRVVGVNLDDGWFLLCCQNRRLIKEQHRTDAQDKRMAVGKQKKKKKTCINICSPSKFRWGSLRLCSVGRLSAHKGQSIYNATVSDALKTSRYIKHAAHSCACKVNIFIDPQSNVFALHVVSTHQASPADCGQNKRAAVLSVRGINIDMLQWPSMLIKYMLIEIQWQLEFHSEQGILLLPKSVKHNWLTAKSNTQLVREV